MAKLDPAAQGEVGRRRAIPARVIFDRRVDDHHLLHPLETGRPPLDEVGHIAKRHQRPDQLLQVEVKSGKLTERHPALRRLVPANHEDQREAKANTELHEGVEGGGEPDQSEVPVDILPIERFEDRLFGALPAVGPNDTDACQVLLCPGGDLGEELLDLLEAQVDLLAKILDGQGDERHRQQQQEGQLGTDAVHHRQDENDPENRLLAVHDRGPDDLTHGAKIVGGPGHEISNPLVLIERERHLLEMPVEVLPEIIFDVAGHVDQGPPLQVEKDPTEKTGPDDDPDGLPEDRVAQPFLPKPVDRLADKPGDERPKAHRSEHKEGSRDQPAAVTKQGREQPFRTGGITSRGLSRVRRREG